MSHPETLSGVGSPGDPPLFDLKLMDEERHEAFTGVHNRWILENLRLGRGPELAPSPHGRIPLIPGVNDDEENLRPPEQFPGRLGLPLPPWISYPTTAWVWTNINGWGGSMACLMWTSPR